MEQESAKLIIQKTLSILGTDITIDVFSKPNGRGYVLSRYQHDDVIITDGDDVIDALDRHCSILPVALSCRINRKAA